MPANDTVKSSWTSVTPNPLSTSQWFVGDSNPAAKPLESVDGVLIPNRALAGPQAYLPGARRERSAWSARPAEDRCR